MPKKSDRVQKSLWKMKMIRNEAKISNNNNDNIDDDKEDKYQQKFEKLNQDC